MNVRHILLGSAAAALVAAFSPAAIAHNGTPVISAPVQEMQLARHGADDGAGHDRNDDRGGRGNEPGEDRHGRGNDDPPGHDAGDDKGGHHEPGDDHGHHGRGHDDGPNHT